MGTKTWRRFYENFLVTQFSSPPWESYKKGTKKTFKKITTPSAPVLT